MHDLASRLAEHKKNKKEKKHPWISDEYKKTIQCGYIFEENRKILGAPPYVPKIFYDQEWPFMDWAFGADLCGKSVLDLMNKWNELHWPLFTLIGDEDIKESLQKMKTFYHPEQKKVNWI